MRGGSRSRGAPSAVSTWLRNMASAALSAAARPSGACSVSARRISATASKSSWASGLSRCFLTLRCKTQTYFSVKTPMSLKGQIVLPAEIRRQDRIEPGQEFDIERLDRGEYRLKRRAAAPNEGVVDWLLACPEKGFFVPIGSESTDTLRDIWSTPTFSASRPRSSPMPKWSNGRATTNVKSP